MRIALRNLLQANQALIKNATSLIGATVITSGLGFVYWWVAARLFTPEAVGFAAAAISAMMLLGMISVLGFGSLLIAELPNHPGHEVSLIMTALVVVGGMGGLLGVLFAVAAPFISANLQPLATSFASVGLFALGVSITTIVQVLDQALIGLLRGEVQFWRNAFFAATKLGILFGVGLWLPSVLGMTIYGTWIAGNLLSMLVVLVFATLRGQKLRNYRPQWTMLRKVGSSALTHHGLNLALTLPSYAIPLVVTIMLSAATNAYFYTAWMIAGFAFVGPLALTTALYAVGARDPSLLAHKLRLTLRLTVLGGLAANVVLLVGADYILSIFGQEYAKQAGVALRVIGVAIFPLIIQDHYIVIQRIHGRIRSAMLLIGTGSLLQLVLAAVGAYFGSLLGLAIGWLIANCVAALFMSRTVYDIARHANVQTTSREIGAIQGHSQ